MAKKDEFTLFLEAKDTVYENLEALQMSLIRCIDEGLMDLEDTLYAQAIDLMDAASNLDTWVELEELVARSKILEQDVAAWLSRHGRTSWALPWPKKSL